MEETGKRISAAGSIAIQPRNIDEGVAYRTPGSRWDCNLQEM
jgi:hypothetical protein